MLEMGWVCMLHLTCFLISLSIVVRRRNTRRPVYPRSSLKNDGLIQHHQCGAYFIHCVQRPPNGSPRDLFCCTFVCPCVMCPFRVMRLGTMYILGLSCGGRKYIIPTWSVFLMTDVRILTNRFSFVRFENSPNPRRSQCPPIPWYIEEHLERGWGVE